MADIFEDGFVDFSDSVYRDFNVTDITPFKSSVRTNYSVDGNISNYVYSFSQAYVLTNSPFDSRASAVISGMGDEFIIPQGEDIEFQVKVTLSKQNYKVLGTEFFTGLPSEEGINSGNSTHPIFQYKAEDSGGNFQLIYPVCSVSNGNLVNYTVRDNIYVDKTQLKQLGPTGAAQNGTGGQVHLIVESGYTNSSLPIRFRGISGGSGIQVRYDVDNASGGNFIIIDSSGAVGGGGGGGIGSCANVGDAADVYVEGTDSPFKFRSLTGAHNSNYSVSNLADTYVSVDGNNVKFYSEPWNGQNVGEAGEPIFLNGNGTFNSKASFKKIQSSDSSISVDSDTTGTVDLKFDRSQYKSYYNWTGANTGEVSSESVKVYVDGTGPVASNKAAFREIYSEDGSVGIGLTNSDNTISIEYDSGKYKPYYNWTGENVGVGSQIYKNGTGPASNTNAVFRKIVGEVVNDSNYTEGEQKATVTVGVSSNDDIEIGVDLSTAAGIGASAPYPDGESRPSGTVLVGGIRNSTKGYYNSIAGGGDNTISGGPLNFVGGGSGNDVNFSRLSSSLGGKNNDISGADFSVILGGNTNLITGGNAHIIGGGDNNQISGDDTKIASTIVGGTRNKILGNTYSFIGAGGTNTIYANNSVIGGGTNNIASGDSSVVFGGSDNQVLADYGFAAGRNSIVSGNHSGAFVLSDAYPTNTLSSGANTLTLNFKSGVYVDSDSGIYINGNPVLTGASGSEGDTLQIVTDRGATTTNAITLQNNLTLSYNYPRINLTDTDNNSDYSILNNDGSFGIYDVTNSAYRLQILSGGNVGIGAVTPLSRLHIGNATGSALGLRFTNPTETVNQYFADDSTDSDFFITYAGNGGAEITLQHDGKLALNASNGDNVGVGTDNPRTSLHVSRAGTTEGGIITIDNPNNTDGAYCGIEFINSTVGYPRSAIFAMRTGGYDAELTFHTSPTNEITGTDYPAATERMRIDHDGRVGIGTNNPSVFNSEANRLVIGDGVGAEGLTIFSGPAHSASINFADGTGGNSSYEGFIQYRHGDEGFRFGAGGGGKVFIGANNTVGIGSLAPNAELEIAASVPTIRLKDSDLTDHYTDIEKAGVYTYLYSRANAANGGFIFLGTAGSTDTEFLRIDTAGNVGIGSSVPSAKLDVAGGIKLLDNNYLTWNGSNTRIVGNSDYLQLQVAAVDKVRVTTSGVGVGTATPHGQLDVFGSQNAETDLGDANNYHLHLHNANDDTDESIGIAFGITSATDAAGASIAHERKGSSSYGDLYFSTRVNGGDVTEKMRITDDGKVGIGVTEPSQKLELFTNTDVSAQLGVAHVGYVGFGDHAGFAHLDNATTSNYALLQSSAGDTFINSAASRHIYFRDGNATIGGFDSNDDFYVDTDTLFVDSSADRVGINDSTPSYALDVNGVIRTQGDNKGGGLLGTQFSNIPCTTIDGFFASTSTEDYGFQNALLMNDLAGFTKWAGVTIKTSGIYKTRGGSAGSYTYSNEAGTGDFDRAFQSNNHTVGSWYTDSGPDGDITTGAANSGSIELYFNGVKSLNYSAQAAVLFGSAAFRATHVKIEAHRTGAWQTILDETGNSKTALIARIASNGGGANATTGLRYTFARAGSYFRINNFYAADYDLGNDLSYGGQYYIDKYYDGRHYSTLYPVTNGGADLGKSSNKYDVIYGNSGNFTNGITIDGNPVVTGSSAEDSDTLQIVTTRGNSTTNNIVIDNTGDGINFAPLTISGATNGTQALFRGTGVHSFIQFQNTTTSYGSMSQHGLTIGNNGNDAYITNREAANLYLMTSGEVAMTIDSQRRVGIGTLTPTQLLDVYGNESKIALTSSAGRNTVLQQGGGHFHIKTSHTNGVAINNNESSRGRLAIYSGTAENIRFASNGESWITGGNVGIGTTDPLVPFHVQGTPLVGYAAGDVNADTIMVIENDDNARLAIVAGSKSEVLFGDALDQDVGKVRYDHSDNHMAFFTNAIEKVRIEAGGNVGIGITAPQSKLDVNLGGDGSTHEMNSTGVNNLLTLRVGSNEDPASVANAGARWGMKLRGFINDASNPNQKSAAVYAVSEDAGAGYNRKVGIALHTSPFDADHVERVRIDCDGQVGIGTTDPQAQLHVASGNILVDSMYGIRFNDYNTRIYTNSETPEDLLIEADQDLHLDPDGVVKVDTAEFQITSSAAYTTHLNYQNLGNNYISQANGGATIFRNSAGTLMSLNSVGTLNVGAAGVTNTRLHVTGAISNSLARFKEGSDGIELTTRTSNGRQQIDFLGTNTSSINAKGSLFINYDTNNDGSNDTISFTRNAADEAGTVDMIITEGKVGINDTSPANMLSVSGDASSQIAVAKITRQQASASNATYTFEVDSSAHTSNMTAAGAMAVDVNAGRAFTINGNGSVGIGTTAPSVPLEVVGDIFINGGPAGGRSLALKRTGATNAWKLVQGHTQTDYLEILEGSDTRFLIKNGGDVGIGTTGPQSKLHVSAGDIRIDNNQQYLAETAGGGVIGVAKMDVSDNLLIGDGNFVIDINGTSERMKITSAGNVLIGQPTDSVDKLQTQGEADLYAARFNGSTNGSQSYGVRIRAGTTSVDQGFLVENTAGADLFKVKGDGKVGIGNTTPVTSLQVTTLDDTSTITIHRDGSNPSTHTSLGKIQFAQDYGSTQQNNWGQIELRTNASSVRTDMNFKVKSTSGVEMTAMTLHGTADDGPKVGIGTTTPSNALDVVGHFSATTKSFLIDHPTKENKKLQYGSLEGPENGVYVRGTTDEETIELPEYWSELVHDESITVVLTPIGKKQDLFIIKKSNKLIKIGGVEGSYDYVVYGERKDIEKLEIEPLKV
jgi:hypothetical protein